MNDYWNYLAHSQEGQERKGHKYYARVAVGRNKLGFTQYRYFYDAREYGAYMTRQRQGKNTQINVPYGQKDRKTTHYVTGTGNTMVRQRDAESDMERARSRGVDTVRTPSDKFGGATGISANSASVTGHAKTVKDHPNLRKAKSAVNKKAAEVQSAVKSGKKKINDLILKAKTEHNRNQWQKTYTAIGDTLYVTNKNTKTGEVRKNTYQHTKAATDFERTMKQVSNSTKNKYKYEPVYQANKAYENASRILSNGRKRVQNLFKRN